MEQSIHLPCQREIGDLPWIFQVGNVGYLKFIARNGEYVKPRPIRSCPSSPETVLDVSSLDYAVFRSLQNLNFVDASFFVPRLKRNQKEVLAWNSTNGLFVVVGFAP